MKNPKQFLRHELLNICTLLTLTLDEEDLSHEQKESMRQYLQVLQLLVEHEEILLGKKPSFFLRDYALKELIDMVLIGYGEIINTQNTKISLDIVSSLEISTDRHYFEVALKYILHRLVQKASFLHFSFHEKQKALVISHDFEPLKDLFQKNITDILEKKNIYNGELMYQLGLFLISQHKKNPDISQDSLSLFLLAK